MILLSADRYSHLLQSLETEGLGKKIRILKSFDEAAFDIKRLKLETVRFEGLFETKKLVSYAQNFQTPKKAATGATSTATPAPISVKKATALLSQTHITPASVKAAVGGTPGTVKAVKKDENGFTQVAKLRAVDPSKVRQLRSSADRSLLTSHCDARSPSRSRPLLLATSTISLAPAPRATPATTRTTIA